MSQKVDDRADNMSEKSSRKIIENYNILMVRGKFPFKNFTCKLQEIYLNFTEKKKFFGSRAMQPWNQVDGESKAIKAIVFTSSSLI